MLNYKVSILSPKITSSLDILNNGISSKNPNMTIFQNSLL